MTVLFKTDAPGTLSIGMRAPRDRPHAADHAIGLSTAPGDTTRTLIRMQRVPARWGMGLNPAGQRSTDPSPREAPGLPGLIAGDTERSDTAPGWNPGYGASAR